MPALQSPKEAVESGLRLFQAGDTQGALQLFLRARQLNPTDDEMRAALYNSACAYTKLRQWQEATNAVIQAVNDYDLRLVVALKDDDLAPLRERREWTKALAEVGACWHEGTACADYHHRASARRPLGHRPSPHASHDPPWPTDVLHWLQMRGGITDTTYTKLRAEAKAPFRLTRIIFVGGLVLGAGVGLLIITTRLVAALTGAWGCNNHLDLFHCVGPSQGQQSILVSWQRCPQCRHQRASCLSHAPPHPPHHPPPSHRPPPTCALPGGEGAPDLGDSLQNFGINLAALLGLGYLVSRDLAAERKDQEVILREEALGELEVLVGGRALPLAAFRGTARPVVLAGSRGQLQRALAASEPYYGLLRERGVCLVPVELSDDDPADRLRKLKQELGGASRGEAGGGQAAATKGFGAGASSSSGSSGSDEAAAPAAGGVSKKDRKWRLEPTSLGEWQRWAEVQQKAAGARNDCIYAQVQLDGTVRASGVGTPPWQKFCDDIPELSSVRTKLTDGVGL